MVLNITSDLEVVLNEVAARQGVSPEEVAIKALKDRSVRRRSSRKMTGAVYYWPRVRTVECLFQTKPSAAKESTIDGLSR